MDTSHRKWSHWRNRAAGHILVREQLGKPIPSGAGPGVREVPRGGEGHAEQKQIPIYRFQHKERKDAAAHDFRRKRGVRDRSLGLSQKEGKGPAEARGRLDDLSFIDIQQIVIDNR